MADKKLPPVPEEEIERPKGNLFGKMLKHYRSEKAMALYNAKNKLFERHSIDFRNSNQYKVVQDRIVLPNGKEVIELRLYKLIDGAAITIETNATSTLEGGISNLREFKTDGKETAK